GEQAFANIETLEDAIADIHHQVPNFLEWVRLPGFLPLFYDDVAFDTRSTVRRLCRQLGLKADPDEVERIAKQERFTQYNKGVPGRAKELPPEDGERILEAFRDFYEEFIPDRAGPPPAAPAPSEPPRAGALKPTDRIWNLLRLRR
ncbi:MAG TPA: sulfotransferase domain-containing protein, partial [Microvirga sp.]|nr:sulfotransferase domain-containing protein [Microvirga sp.]